jgi:hypothetical protein
MILLVSFAPFPTIEGCEREGRGGKRRDKEEG